MRFAISREQPSRIRYRSLALPAGEDSRRDLPFLGGEVAGASNGSCPVLGSKRGSRLDEPIHLAVALFSRHRQEPRILGLAMSQ